MTSLSPVTLAEVRATAYEPVVGSAEIARLRHRAEALSGVRVAQINATPVGGGVAEMMVTQAPLANDLGVTTDWLVLDGAHPDFFEVTKATHNRLQSHAGSYSPQDIEVFHEHQRGFAEDFVAHHNHYDVVVVHDPQPVGLAQLVKELDPSNTTRFVWRCHIDTSNPNPEAWSLVRPYLDSYDALIFTIPQFVPADLDHERIEFMAPAIDPLKLKNQPVAPATAHAMTARMGIDPDRPLTAQVARLDPHKDPIGVIDAYHFIKKEIPDVQLALLGVIEAVDDPEAFRVADEVITYADGDPDIHIFTDPQTCGHPQVAAVQTHAQVIFNKSLREGFGLSVTEAMWKATPVIGGRTGGIVLQLRDGLGGFTVEPTPAGVAQAADAAIMLIRNPESARQIAETGREVVRERFLITRLIREEFDLFIQLCGLSAMDQDWEVVAE